MKTKLLPASIALALLSSSVGADANPFGFFKSRNVAQKKTANTQSFLIFRLLAKIKRLEAEIEDLRQNQSPDELQAFLEREDIAPLPDDLKDRLVELFERPNSYPPLTVFAEADDDSLLFQYYLIDTVEFEPNIFTARIPGINANSVDEENSNNEEEEIESDFFATGANFANGGLPTIGSVRLALEPKEGLPIDPDDPGAFIDIFTDVSGLFVINNESGWYEGWMIRDIPVPEIADANADGSARYGTITQADADILAAMGTGNNTPGNIFTTNGEAVRLPAVTDRFPGDQGNTVSYPVSIGAFNALQQSDLHAYWEFNAGTNWVFPHYELPFTGGVPGTFDNGMQYGFPSTIPGSGPEEFGGVDNTTSVEQLTALGDNPNNPRDPDRAEGGFRETRNRFIPSGLTDELLFNVFMRPASFLPDITDVGERLLRSYAIEVATVDENGDGSLSFEEADLSGSFQGGDSEGEISNRLLYLSPRAFNRFAITRELNDGLLAPRFAPSQRAYVAAGNAVNIPNGELISASVDRDADDR